MAVSQDILEADKKARVALLNAITAKIPGAGPASLLQLAEAYHHVTSSTAPRDPSTPSVSSLA